MFSKLLIKNARAFVCVLALFSGEVLRIFLVLRRVIKLLYFIEILLSCGC